MVRPKNETESLLLSITKNCETLIKQSHRKAGEILEIKRTKSKETFHFKPPLSIERSWMVGWTSIEVYSFFFHITEENNKIELFTKNYDEFSFEELKEELEEIFSISDVTPHHIKHEKTGPRIIEAYKKFRSDKSSTDGYLNFLLGYARSLLRDL